MKSALSLFPLFLHLFIFYFFSKHVRFAEVWICSALESTQAINIWGTAPNQPTKSKLCSPNLLFLEKKKSYFLSDKAN